MARFSLSNILGRRKKIRIVTIFATILLLVVAVSVLVIKNPGKSKATEINCDGQSSDCLYNSNTTTYTIYSNSNFGNDPHTTPRQLYWQDNGTGKPQVPIPPYANVILDGGGSGITVTTTYLNGDSHPIVFQNLTLQNNAKLTQIAVGATNTYSNQAVNLSITGDLTIKSGSSIDVSGQGFAGSPDYATNGYKGYGPSGGTGCTGAGNNRCAAGGGAHGGIGGSGANAPLSTNGTGGTPTYDNLNNPTLPGSGGGGATSAGRYNAAGGNGGGVITLAISGNLYLDSGSKILANGQVGSIAGVNFNVSAGSGAGGSINITASSIHTNLDGNSPNIKGGEATSPYLITGGADGTTNLTSLNENISAAGGDSKSYSFGGTQYQIGGGGGGGRIFIQPVNLSQWCYISSDIGIPASCENQDVTIDGGGIPSDDPSDDQITVDAGAVQVEWTNNSTTDTGTQCSDPSDQYCESKRTFTNLTIENGAILTHSALTAVSDGHDNLVGGDMTQVVNGTLVGTTGTARWKKVDLVITGSLTLNDSSINVDEKGYPGGFAFSTGLGSDQHGANAGYGPGGGAGLCSSGGSSSRGGGGSFAGLGDPGNADPTGSHGSVIYIDHSGGGVYSNPSDAPTDLEWGSGGGGGCQYGGGGGDYFSAANGAAGGGKINISANSLIMDDFSKISAEGAQGNYYHEPNGYTADSGGGSGGSIWIDAVNLPFPIQGGSPVTVINGYTAGKIIFNSTEYNLTADGGLMAEGYGYSGGGGWIVINTLSNNNITVNKTLYPVKRNGQLACTIDSSGKPNITSSCFFDPYALQSGDTIEVYLEIAGANGSYEIKDKRLSDGGIHSCIPNAMGFGSFAPTGPPVNWAADPLDFNGTGNGNIQDIYYQCTVH